VSASEQKPVVSIRFHTTTWYELAYKACAQEGKRLLGKEVCGHAGEPRWLAQRGQQASPLPNLSSAEPRGRRVSGRPASWHPLPVPPGGSSGPPRIRVPHYSGSDVKGADAGTGVGWRRRYRSSTAILCVKMATGTGAVPAFIGASRHAEEGACPPPRIMPASISSRGPPLPPHPFSLAWGGDQEVGEGSSRKRKPHKPSFMASSRSPSSVQT